MNFMCKGDTLWSSVVCWCIVVLKGQRNNVWSKTESPFNRKVVLYKLSATCARSYWALLRRLNERRSGVGYFLAHPEHTSNTWPCSIIALIGRASVEDNTAAKKIALSIVNLSSYVNAFVLCGLYPMQLQSPITRPGAHDHSLRRCAA